ncbi:helix-turn-helix domain protein [Vibrio phage 1.036.O._10N.286.45.C3]|nr:helix-turn-helix domain protein [Vibrio phage 1.036.O._10N.286.45.C3]
MSIKIMNAVWSSHLPQSISKNKRSTVKIVLLKLADNANDNGKCWPSMARIAHETELSERSVIRAIDCLKSANIIIVRTHRKDGVKHNTYFINIPLIDDLKHEYDSSKLTDNDNPFMTPSDNLSKPTDRLSKEMDQMSVKPSLTIKEPSHTDISKADEHVFSIDELVTDGLKDYPLCTEAIYHLDWINDSGKYKAFTGSLTLQEWSDCESAMRSVDDFDVEYFTWWMEEKSPSMRKTPSLPNMLTDMNGTPFDQFYDSTFMQEWE